MPVLLLSWFQKQMQMGTAKCAFRSFAQGAQPSTQSHPAVFQKPVLIATPAVPKSIETPTTVLFLKCQLRASPGNHQQPEPFPLFCVAGQGARMLPDFILFFSFFACGNIYSWILLPPLPTISHQPSFPVSAGSFQGSINGPIKHHPCGLQPSGAEDAVTQVPYLCL